MTEGSAPPVPPSQHNLGIGYAQYKRNVHTYKTREGGGGGGVAEVSETTARP